jgi:pimeloyl-ACP methyl ester carboxylesterase
MPLCLPSGMLSCSIDKVSVTIGNFSASPPICTRALSGTDDAVVAKENAAALTRLLPHARLLLVKYAGHAMMYQYPVAMARAIDSFAHR